MDIVNKPTLYHVGDDVLAKKFTDNSFYPATIERCFTDQRFLIAWKDGKTTYRVHSADTICAVEADAGDADSHSRSYQNTARVSQGESQQDQCVNTSVDDSSDEKQLRTQVQLSSAKTRSSSRARSEAKLRDFLQPTPTKEGAILVFNCV